MTLTGRFEHVDLEGGIWLFVADDGRRFELAEQPAGCASGDRAEVDGEIDDASASFRMAGPILRLVRIRRR